MVGEVAKGFVFEPGGIGGIFKAHRLRVPTFQREYSWESEQVDQLLSDLNRAKTEHTDHFLGTIVTISKGAHDPLEIVDGQQRLTTTSLLILAIREVQNELRQPADVIHSINNDYLSSFDRKAGGPVPKLALNIDDNEFFRGMIGGVIPDAARESHRRLLAAHKRAKGFVKNLAGGFSDADKPTVLNDWLDFIEHGASVILVKTDDASKAFKMFETLNDRGLKTSQADLVKSYLFGEAGGRVAEAQVRWSTMKDGLEEIADDDRAINFLRHALIATKRFVRADEIYDAVQKTVRGESNAASFLTSLETLSRAYVATFSPNADFWRDHSVTTARALSVFNRFDLKPIRPLVLALAVSFTANEFDAAMRLLVSISVRLVLASRTRSGTIEQTFAIAALQVFEKRITTAVALKPALANVTIGDADFATEFTTARVSNANLARYYLRALEAANANEREPWFIENDDPGAITLEHVLPQNPDGDWDGIDADTRKTLVRRLGNLCLLQKSGNEAISTKPFAEKRVAYAASPYVTTSMIASETDWDAGTIEARQTQLASLALKAWPV
jgi:hypothetical protein